MSGIHHPVPGAPGLTVHTRLGAGAVLRHGTLQPYRRVAAAEGEPHRVRADLLGADGGNRFALTAGTVRPLLTLAHVTDLQLPDVGSTARFEFFNREMGDPAFAKLVPVQRPQEALTARAMQAMVSTLNGLHAGAGAPLSGRSLDLVVTTGDAIDNAQWNEVRNWLALMDGGRVRPGSGGGEPVSVQAQGWPDDIFWRPDGGHDLWREQFGFLDRPRLLEQALAEFESTGLLVPWLACYGNHEALVQGVGVVTAELAAGWSGTASPPACGPACRGPRRWRCSRRRRTSSSARGTRGSRCRPTRPGGPSTAASSSTCTSPRPRGPRATASPRRTGATARRTTAATSRGCAFSRWTPTPSPAGRTAAWTTRSSAG
ncbi:hypothetical protein [Kineococcus rubinsiae]|uniref:hypothetical protein n=1 Tax=Kineococcus rubinsiae TaxID=2609562 RepID=UPI001431CFD3|nr:hypothetical protein [Kineococcus rubinsiae]NIZ92218.1 hypothetical protein [Kineococcus rubinsiae]